MINDRSFGLNHSVGDLRAKSCFGINIARVGNICSVLKDATESVTMSMNIEGFDSLLVPVGTNPSQRVA